MPRSHICPSCLTELGRIRAVPDPHYGLAVVVCPECSMASVRTRHPDIEYWRNFRRVQWTARKLFAIVILTLIASSLFLLMSILSEDMLTPVYDLDPFNPFLSGMPDDAIAAASMIVGSVVLMMIMCLLYLHRTLFFGALVLLIFSLFFVTIDYWITSAYSLVANFGGYAQQWDIPGKYEMIPRLKRFGLLYSISLLGIIPAYFLSRTVRNAPKNRFRRLLRKRRKQRTIHD